MNAHRTCSVTLVLSLLASVVTLQLLTSSAYAGEWYGSCISYSGVCCPDYQASGCESCCLADYSYHQYGCTFEPPENYENCMATAESLYEECNGVCEDCRGYPCP